MTEVRETIGQWGRGAIADLSAFMRQTGRRAVDVLLPPQCLLCDAITDQSSHVCHTCWPDLTFISEPCCDRCGYPFPYDNGASVTCAACLAAPPPYDRARSVLAYDERSRGLILAFKHGDRLHGRDAFAAWMTRAGAKLVAEADVLAPVPLHRRRLFQRRYNQSALLSQAIGRRANRPVVVDLLRRTRPTPTQAGLSPAARARNVRGAFAVNSRFRSDLPGARVLLIDDVLTTGATVSACTLSLRRAGAVAVDVLTLARVVRPVSASI